MHASLESARDWTAGAPSRASSQVATYTCDCCGFEIYQEVGFKKQFLPLQDCPGPTCTRNKVPGRLFLQTRGSKFVKYQELRLQELPDQVSARD